MLGGADQAVPVFLDVFRRTADLGHDLRHLLGRAPFRSRPTGRPSDRRDRSSSAGYARTLRSRRNARCRSRTSSASCTCLVVLLHLDDAVDRADFQARLAAGAVVGIDDGQFLGELFARALFGHDDRFLELDSAGAGEAENRACSTADDDCSPRLCMQAGGTYTIIGRNRAIANRGISRRRFRRSQPDRSPRRSERRACADATKRGFGWCGWLRRDFIRRAAQNYNSGNDFNRQNSTRTSSPGRRPGLRIIQFPHPTLRRTSKPLRRVDDELRQIVREMFDLMYQAKGIGLAANQVDLPYRLFVLNLTGDAAEAGRGAGLHQPGPQRAQGLGRGRRGLSESARAVCRGASARDDHRQRLRPDRARRSKKRSTACLPGPCNTRPII